LELEVCKRWGIFDNPIQANSHSTLILSTPFRDKMNKENTVHSGEKMKKYKLTYQNLQTYNGFQWEVGIPAPELDGEGELCTGSWYHYYHDPLLAVLMNSAHADIENPRGWEVDAKGEHKDDNGLKGGCTKMKLVREISLPKVSKTQRIAFAILCAKEVYEDREWNKWADGWLSGEDRSTFSVNSAYTVAYAVANANTANAANAAIAYAYLAAANAANAAKPPTPPPTPPSPPPPSPIGASKNF
jgi:hypothetical protein